MIFGPRFWEMSIFYSKRYFGYSRSSLEFDPQVNYYQILGLKEP
jgi:hypothetical protein